MVGNETQNTRRPPPRRRAPGACLACRARKVRCDVAQRGAPCTNCSLDENQCVVKARPTKYRTAQSSGGDKASKSTENIPIRPPSGSPESSNPQKSPAWTEYDPTYRGLNDASRLGSANDVGGQPGISIGGNSPGGFEQETYGDAAKQMGDQYPSTGQLPSTKQPAFDRPTTQADGGSPPSTDIDVIFSFYPFLELDIQSHMSPEDVNFLEQQACFRVPTRPALDELVREYFLHVHPGLPMIDEGSFWDMYTYRGHPTSERPRMPLFVFHAMLFAACSFLSPASIRKIGFSNTRAARAAYYRRAKLLFDFNGEADPISTAQGALLLTYNSSMRNYKQVNTFWLGIAIQFAKDGEAHQYHTKRLLTAERRNVLKRLWWCCIIRDRILPLGTRRPLKISTADFDFEMAPLIEADFGSEIRHSKVYVPRVKSSLVELFIALCSLAVSLTEIIMTLYPSHGSQDLKLLDEEDINEYFGRIESCKSSLTIWFERAATQFSVSSGIRETHHSIVLYTNLMYIYYFSAMLALYQEEILVISTKPEVVQGHWNRMCHSRRQVEEAASSITENLNELIQLKLSNFLPISIVAYAALPLVLHVLDVKLSTSHSQTVRRERRLKIYTDIMKVLKSHYDGTDEVSDIIGTMMNYVTLERPIQGFPATVLGESELHQNGFELGSALSTSIKQSKYISDWGDVLLRRTNLYLRLAVTIDLSLSRGCFPKDADFPISLQSPNQIETRFPLYRITIEDVSDSYEGAGQASSESQYTNASPASRRMNNNSFSTALVPSNEGFVRQLEYPVDNSSGNPEISSFLGFEMGIPDSGALSFDQSSAAWADGMFMQ